MAPGRIPSAASRRECNRNAVSESSCLKRHFRVPFPPHAPGGQDPYEAPQECHRRVAGASFRPSAPRSFKFPNELETKIRPGRPRPRRYGVWPQLAHSGCGIVACNCRRRGRVPAELATSPATCQCGARGRPLCRNRHSSDTCRPGWFKPSAAAELAANIARSAIQLLLVWIDGADKRLVAP